MLTRLLQLVLLLQLLQLCEGLAGQQRQQVCQQSCCGCQHAPLSRRLLLLVLLQLLLLELLLLLLLWQSGQPLQPKRRWQQLQCQLRACVVCRPWQFVHVCHIPQHLQLTAVTQLADQAPCCFGPRVTVGHACCQLQQCQAKQQVCLQLQQQLRTDSTIGFVHL